ncbi:MAG TPA: class I SAM-dependent methyltransferase [Micromonosporaceae bacterium]
MYDRVRESYDRVAQRYADEFGGELAGKPLDRALLTCLSELVRGLDESPGTVGDLGCGPGHVAAYLAGLGTATVAVDLSPAMIEVGRASHPGVQFRVGSLLALPITDGELSGAVAFYSIIHLRAEDRPISYAEMARVIRPGGWLLVAFHVSFAGGEPGWTMHADQWWGERVDLDFHYLDPAEVAAGLTAAGFEVMARTNRQPWPGVEHESQRCYLLCRRA